MALEKVLFQRRLRILLEGDEVYIHVSLWKEGNYEKRKIFNIISLSF